MGSKSAYSNDEIRTKAYTLKKASMTWGKKKNQRETLFLRIRRKLIPYSESVTLMVPYPIVHFLLEMYLILPEFFILGKIFKVHVNTLCEIKRSIQMFLVGYY